MHIVRSYICLWASRWYPVMPCYKETGCSETRLGSCPVWSRCDTITNYCHVPRAVYIMQKIFVWASNWYLAMPPLAEPVWYRPDAIQYRTGSRSVPIRCGLVTVIYQVLRPMYSSHQFQISPKMIILNTNGPDDEYAPNE